MQKYALKDHQTLKPVPSRLTRKTVNHIPRFGNCNPFMITHSFQNRIPPEVYQDFKIKRKTPAKTNILEVQQTPDASTILQQTPDASTIKVTSASTAKRRLFNDPADSEPQPSAKVTEWLSKQGAVHYPEQPESTCTDSSMPEEEKYGFKLPSWLCTDSAPKLIRQHRHLSGCPLVEEEKMAVARDNHEIVRRWLKDCSIEKKVGSGHVDVDHQAIQASAKDCKFRAHAEEIIKSIHPVGRYPVEQYIKELAKKEEQAITTARIFRDKWEESVEERMQDAALVNKKILAMRTYWRKNIAEQCSRGGKMVNLALQNYK